MNSGVTSGFKTREKAEAALMMLHEPEQYTIYEIRDSGDFPSFTSFANPVLGYIIVKGSL